MEACGCGEEHIPWMLAKFGLLGAAGLFLGLLVAMILAGWLLVLAVSLYRRWRYPPLSEEVGETSGEGLGERSGERFEQSSQDSLGGFTWTTDDR
ncbi:hypothetical protein [Streptomyces sp. TLI_185]|uniref:hypothetical protein n=1 Tax=Streptomyces sp. TLI_185 TaxID=2485151 RepID=UPI000F4E0836|nr:hypothetical protein [Streptomyces sp. TLI_185]RPF35819.1 hypothetical protein EDD92_5844 [Streptomyces sp. TLI_185]